MNDLSILPILRNIPLFAELDETIHAEIIKHITMQYFPANYSLFKEGDPGTRLYILKSGSVKIFSEKDSDHPIATLRANDFFGEMALFRDKPRSASAVTVEDCEIFLLEKADFYELVLKNPVMAAKLSEEFLRRIEENQKRENQ
ncbi:MAG: cyclic nucleotide-binding domain-containing protein [Candidatus Gracilibacteria bacterium]